MNWQERDYNRPTGSGGGGLFGGGGGLFGGGGGGGGGWQFANPLSGVYIVKWLLFINIAVWVLDLFMGGGVRDLRNSQIAAWGAFSIQGALSEWQIWRWFTYQFIHAGFGHLLMNMVGLFFFGPLLERWWGSRRFLAFYLICGICGAWFYAALYFLLGHETYGVLPATQLVGASGAIFGILIGAAVIAPNQTVMLLIPPIPMKMRTLALILLGVTAFIIITGGPNIGGQAAHLGGAIMGYLLVKRPWALDFADRIAAGARDGSPRSTDRLTRRAERQRRREAEEEAEVDRILVKVKDEGLQSLTSRERATLRRATQRQGGRR